MIPFLFRFLWKQEVCGFCLKGKKETCNYNQRVCVSFSPFKSRLFCITSSFHIHMKPSSLWYLCPSVWGQIVWWCMRRTTRKQTVRDSNTAALNLTTTIISASSPTQLSALYNDLYSKYAGKQVCLSESCAADLQTENSESLNWFLQTDERLSSSVLARSAETVW